MSADQIAAGAARAGVPAAGSSETIRVDVRVIAACNVDLDEEARRGGSGKTSTTG